MKKALFLVAICTLFFNSVKASHFSGGEVRYEFNGTNYTVYVTLYKVCEWSSASLPNIAVVNFKSASTSKNFNRSLPLINFDTVNITCGGATSTCLSSSGTIPGYIAAYFKDTVSITAASDWVISYTDAARITGMMNLASGSMVMYLQTTLNNTAAINSNPLIASSPTYYMTVGSAVAVPLQAIDPEGDSLDFQLVNPMDNATTSSTYSAGYSLASPFGTGGVCSLNTTTKTLNMMGATAGKFVIAYKISEYRNSVLIAAYHRELMIVILPGTTALTFPYPNSGTIFSTYTCPGQSNSITLNFSDPTATDSVYLTVLPPIMAGWTFSSSTSNGLGGASTTITWTTPSGMNPATLPHFFIKIRARDNGCPNASTEYALTVRTRQCLADSVWPGDANGDFTVNVYDPLAIAIASGKTGAGRTGATTSWTAQACAPWANVFVTNNTNMKHADCDGNGTVNSTDLGAVTANYSLSHPKGGGSHYKTTGLPDLYFDVTGINFSAGSTVNVPIKLGSATNPMNSIYGLATKITIDGITLQATPIVNTTGSWLGTSGNTLNFIKTKTNNAIDWAFARTNQSNTGGQGTIATLSFSIPANVPTGTQIKLDFDDAVTRLIDLNGMVITGYNIVEATANSTEPTRINNRSNDLGAVIVPNPSSSEAFLLFTVNTKMSYGVHITDMAGRVVWQYEVTDANGQQRISLPVLMKSGFYIVKLVTEEKEMKVMQWAKQ